VACSLAAETRLVASAIDVISVVRAWREAAFARADFCCCIFTALTALVDAGQLHRMISRAETFVFVAATPATRVVERRTRGVLLKRGNPWGMRLPHKRDLL